MTRAPEEIGLVCSRVEESVANQTQPSQLAPPTSSGPRPTTTAGSLVALVVVVVVVICQQLAAGTEISSELAAREPFNGRARNINNSAGSSNSGSYST